MKFWVDYTNHRGERRWREIESVYSIDLHQYPLLATQERLTLCMVVKLADRSENRTLALTSCHRFYEGDAPPAQRWFDPEAQRMIDAGSAMIEKLKRDEAKMAEVLERENKAMNDVSATLAQVLERENKVVRERDELRTTSLRLAQEKASAVTEAANAIRRLTEMERGGYTPVIQARMETVEAKVAKLERMVPEAVTKVTMAAETLRTDLQELMDDVAARMTKAEPKGKPKGKPDLSGLAEMLEAWANEPDEDELPDEVKAQFPEGTTFEKVRSTPAGDVWKASQDAKSEPEADNCQCIPCITRRALFGAMPAMDEPKPKGKKVPISEVVKGMRERGELPPEAQASKAEAKGRNPRYSGVFEGDAEAMERTDAAVKKLIDDVSGSPGYDPVEWTITLPLWDVARVVSKAHHLDFATLASANERRQREWDQDGQLTGPLGLLYRSNELCGEAGELANKIKKWVRELLGINGTRTNMHEVAHEIADVVICCDLLAADLGIDLAAAVQAKFNITSKERDLKTRL